MRAYRKKLKKAWLWIRIRQVRTKRWWRQQDRRFGVWWRIGNGAAAVLILVAAVIPVLQQIATTNSYKLSAEALQLVGRSDPTLAKQLSYNSKTRTYEFNKSAAAASGNNPLAAMQAQIGTASGKGNDKSLYGLDVPEDFSKGVTYHDTNTDLSFSMVPNFKASPGKVVSGHLVFPLADDTQGVYTLKNNGLKEDIVVNKPSSDTMRFSYTLHLPKTLAIKTIPNSGGNIGVYSADPTLFGNISYGSETDRASVEKARENGSKTNLVFGLPSPVVKDAHGNTVGSARFELNGDQLSVVATGLAGAKGPITIDPSVVVTSTSDFQTGNNEDDNIDFSTSGQISRSGLSGGTLSSWTVNTNSGHLNSNGVAAVYNGYLYLLEGTYNGTSPMAEYAAINASDGTVGTFTDTSTPISARNYPGVAAYNGYLYLWGGYNLTSGALNATEYAKINSDGSLGTWQAGSTMVTAECRSGNVEYGGYIYALGGVTSPASNCGNTSTGLLNSVQYAPLKADGSIGTWSTTTSVGYATTGMMSSIAVAYNGYMYSLVGTKDGASNWNGVQYAKINSDGTLGSWITTTTFPGGGDYRMGYAVANGYIYTVGTASQTATVRYISINANGSLGTWQTTSSLNTGRWGNGTAFYNGYIYTYGGSTAGGTTATIEYAKVDPAGTAGAYTQFGGTNFTTTRQGSQAVAYKGKLYEMGGVNGSAAVNTIYAASINADGSLGNFTNTSMTSITSNMAYFAAFAYNDNMYVIGGCSSVYASCTTAGNDLATVYKAPINSSGNIGSWTAQTSLGTALYGLSATVYNGTVYVLGGINASTFQTAIYYQSIDSSGNLGGTWNTSAQTMPSSNEAYVGATVYGGYMYLVGGCSAGATSCSTATNNVYYAPITSGGDLASAFTSTNAFTTARGDLGVAAINGYLYLTGGRANTTSYADTQFALINSDGSIGSWTSSAASTLATARYGVGTAAYGGMLYVLGGYNGTTYYNNTQYAPVNNGGSGALGSWGTSGNAMGQKVYNAGFATYNGYLYALSGSIGGSNNSVIQHAPINADGTIGTWVTDTATTPSAFSATSATAYNGYIYLVGGLSGGTPQAATYYAALSTSDGSVGTLQSTTSLNTARYGNAIAQYGGYIYALGGCQTVTLGACTSIVTSVEFAAINTNGTLGTWHYTHSSTDDGTSFVSGFTSARFAPSAVAYGGYLYLLGGCTTYSSNSCASSDASSDVQYAALNSNGTVGTWNTTTSFPTGRYQFAVGAYDGYLYVVGGNAGSSTFLNDVQYVPINANGTLGNWGAATSFTTARYGEAAGIYNGNLFVYGGCSSSVTNCNSGNSAQSDTQYVTLQSQARTAHYSKMLDFSGAVNVSSITYNGTLPTGAAAVQYRSAGSNGVLGSLAQTSTISGTAGCLGNTSATRYVWLYITLDDSYGAGSGGMFPDSAGTNAKLTDITVNYSSVHPTPNIRLRHGQTLQSGNLSVLDTCYP